MSNKKKEHSDKTTDKKQAASEAIQQWIGSLTKAMNKTVPELTKKVTEEAGKVSEQLHKNPVFNDMKQRILETGKKAGEKLGLSAESDTAESSPPPAAVPPKKKTAPKKKAAPKKAKTSSAKAGTAKKKSTKKKPTSDKSVD